jgi:hypothetical protein
VSTVMLSKTRVVDVSEPARASATVATATV